MPETDINKLDISNRMLKAYEQKQNVDHDIIMRDEELGFSYRNSGAQDMLEEAERFETSAMEQSEIDNDGTRVIESGLLNGLAKGATQINELLGIDGAVNYLSESFADSTGIRLRTKEPETIGGQLASGLGQALPGILPAVSALRTAGYGPLLADVLGGFIGDFATSDVSDAEGLAQLIQMIPSETAQQFGDVVQNFIRDPESGDEKDFQARLVGSIPGLVLTPLLSGIGRLVVAAKNSGAGQEILEFINAAGESAQQRIAQKAAERGATLNMGVDPTDLTDPLIAGAGKLAGVGINQPKRVGTTGKYVGSPDITTPQKLGSLRKKVRQLAKAGEPAKFWYERSGRAILEAVGGNKEEAEKLIEAIAITSSTTPVKANMGFALQAYSQWKAAQPIKTGKYPKAMVKKIEEAFAGKEWEGKKTSVFYNNLMAYVDPSKAQDVTVDIWMMRAFGFKGKNNKPYDGTPTDAQYKFVSDEVKKISDEFGWDNQQTQAAIWVGAKAKSEKTPITKSAYDYADALNDNLAQVSSETIPGKTATHMLEMFDAPYQQQADFHVQTSKALQDENGTEIIAKELRVPSPGDFEAPGYFEGKVSPGTQTKLAAPKLYKGPDYGKIDESAEALLNAYSVARGILLKQDAMAWHRPFYNATKRDSNGVDVSIGRPFSEKETMLIADIVAKIAGHTEYAPIATENGVRFINFDYLGLDNLKFQTILEGALVKMEFDGNEGYVAKKFAAQVNYIENDWSVHKNGEGYLETGLKGRSDLQRKVRGIISKAQNRVEDVEEEFSTKYGWVRNKSINSAYRRIDEIDQDQALPLEVPDG